VLPFRYIILIYINGCLNNNAIVVDVASGHEYINKAAVAILYNI
jgi:hypothetical protein